MAFVIVVFVLLSFFDRTVGDGEKGSVGVGVYVLP